MFKKYEESLEEHKKRVRRFYEFDDEKRIAARLHPWAIPLIEYKLFSINRDEETKDSIPFIWTGKNKGYLIHIFNNYLQPFFFKTGKEFYSLIGANENGTITELKPGKNLEPLPPFKDREIKREIESIKAKL